MTYTKHMKPKGFTLRRQRNMKDSDTMFIKKVAEYIETLDAKQMDRPKGRVYVRDDEWFYVKEQA